MNKMVNVAIVDRSTLASDVDVHNAVIAIQTQIVVHFMPHWGVGANLYHIDKREPPPNAMWWQILVDDFNQPGALGFHETTPDGNPIGYTSIKASMDAGDPWSTVLDHEMLEMLADPFIFSLVALPPTWQPAPSYTWLEVCDPVESLHYTSMSVELSDFVLPSWFGAPQTTASGPRYSLLNGPSAAFALTAGGYMTVVDAMGRVTQIVGPPPLCSYRIKPSAMSRRTRRLRRSK